MFSNNESRRAFSLVSRNISESPTKRKKEMTGSFLLVFTSFNYGAFFKTLLYR